MQSGDRRLVSLTEVHVLGQRITRKKSKKPQFPHFLHEEGAIPAKAKYLSKWCGNPLALTIYVNANELHSLPLMGSRSRHCPA